MAVVHCIIIFIVWSLLFILVASYISLFNANISYTKEKKSTRNGEYLQENALYASHRLACCFSFTCYKNSLFTNRITQYSSSVFQCTYTHHAITCPSYAFEYQQNGEQRNGQHHCWKSQLNEEIERSFAECNERRWRKNDANGTELSTHRAQNNCKSSYIKWWWGKKWRKSPLCYWHNHQLINNNNNNNNNEHRSHSQVHKPTTVYWTKSSPVQRCFMFNAQINWNMFKSGLNIIFFSFNFVLAFLRLMHTHLMRSLNNNNIVKNICKKSSE